MASLTGKTISSTYDGLLKTTDNDVLNATAKEITDGLGNGSGVALDTGGNVTISGDFQAQGGIKDSSGDLGTSGQVLSSTGTGTNWSDVGGAVDSVNAGTGISVDVTTGNVTVTNDSPDQTVALTDGGDIAISGTYPSFTLTNSAPNATHTGEVTGATALTIANGAVTNAKMAADSVDSDQYVDGSIDTVHLANDIVTYDKLGVEFTSTEALGSVSTTATLNFETDQVFTATMTDDTDFVFSNANIGMTKDLILTGSFDPSFPVGTKQIAGTYDGSVSNFIQIVAVANGDYWLSVSQEQV